MKAMCGDSFLYTGYVDWYENSPLGATNTLDAGGEDLRGERIS